MSVRSYDLDSTPRRATLSPNRIAAVVVWCGGCAATYGFISGAIAAPWWLAIIVAVCAQGVLTLAERPTLHGKVSLLGAAALTLDTALNAGGLYVPMTRLGATPTGQMFADVFGTDAALSKTAALVVAWVLGLFIAGLPEQLWRQKD
jgi:hypothetical protein